MNSYYEKRYLSKSKVSNLEFSVKKDEGKTLVETLFQCNKVILLGNPGMGKTTELKNAFDLLWEKKSDTGFVPIEIDLKYFRKKNIFEDLILYPQWKNLPGLIFILDGLDEIADIHDFISEFELFIASNQSQNIKYLISCRTNIYEKYLININDFEVFFLKNLTSSQVESILKHKYFIPQEKQKLSAKQFEYLHSPFFLDLFAKYYLNKGVWPKSDSEIWDLYINQTIENHKRKFIKKKLLSTPILLKNFKKVAVINELMQRSYIDEIELHEVLGEEYQEFLENPFLNLNSTQKNWSFEHKQIQEYFVAKVMLEQNFLNLLKLVKVPQVNAIHPSIFNSLSFYINIADPNELSYQKLVSWLQNHQLEVLLKSEPNRIKVKLKEEVFQRYFKRECIDKTHWISTNRTFEVHEIANFADCEGNFEYLIRAIKDPLNHIRTSISAINVLAYFNLTDEQRKKVKQLMLEMIQSSLIELPIKAECIQLIDIQKFTIEDNSYLKKILQYFELEKNKQINLRLLSLINQHKTIDEFFPLIKAEFLRENGIEQRNDNDNVIRGNSYVVQKLILRLNDNNDFLNIIKYYFDDQYNLRFDDDFAEKIKVKLVSFIFDDEGIIIDFLKLIGNRIIYRTHSTFMKKLIEESDTKRLAIEFLLSNHIFTEIDYFLAGIVDSKTIDLVEEYLDQNQNVSDEKVERFRNFVSNLNSRSLAISFHEKMLKKGRVFKEKAYSEEEVSKLFKKIEKKTQEGYNLLYDKVNLLKELKKIFEDNNDSIDLEKYEDINHNWYIKNGHGSIMNPVLSFIGNLVYSDRQEIFSYAKIEKLIQNEDILIESIKKTLERNKNNSWEFHTNEQQRKKLKEWCKRACDNIDFDKIINLKEPNRFSYGPDYEKFKTVIFFWREFHFQLPKDFLLKCLEYIDLEGNIDGDEKLIDLKKSINDDKAFDNQIIRNIKENILFDLVLYGHINYAIEQELKEVYPLILEHFKRDISIFNENKKIEKLIESIHQNEGEQIAIEKLKEFCENINSRICWVGIKILNRFQQSKEYCIGKALSYLKSKETKYLPEALEVLFINNHLDAIDYFIQIMENNSISNIRFINFGNYSNIKSYGILNKLYAICYGNDSDGFDSHLLRSFFNSYIANLSRNDDGFNNVQNELKKIKQTLIKIGKDLFYINMLIEDSNNSYINYKSRPYTFSEALSKIEELSL